MNEATRNRIQKKIICTKSHGNTRGKFSPPIYLGSEVLTSDLLSIIILPLFSLRTVTLGLAVIRTSSGSWLANAGDKCFPRDCRPFFKRSSLQRFPSYGWYPLANAHFTLMSTWALYFAKILQYIDLSTVYALHWYIVNGLNSSI